MRWFVVNLLLGTGGTGGSAQERKCGERRDRASCRGNSSGKRGLVRTRSRRLGSLCVLCCVGGGQSLELSGDAGSTTTVHNAAARSPDVFFSGSLRRRLDDEVRVGSAPIARSPYMYSPRPSAACCQSFIAYHHRCLALRCALCFIIRQRQRKSACFICTDQTTPSLSFCASFAS